MIFDIVLFVVHRTPIKRQKLTIQSFYSNQIFKKNLTVNVAVSLKTYTVKSLQYKVQPVAQFHHTHISSIVKQVLNVTLTLTLESASSWKCHIDRAPCLFEPMTRRSQKTKRFKCGIMHSFHCKSLAVNATFIEKLKTNK